MQKQLRHSDLLYQKRNHRESKKAAELLRGKQRRKQKRKSKSASRRSTNKAANASGRKNDEEEQGWK